MKTPKTVKIDWQAFRKAMFEKKAAREKKAATSNILFRMAALRSSFQPDLLEKALPPNSLSSESIKRESSKLITASEVVTRQHGIFWQLKEEERKKVLNEIGSLSAMEAYLPGEEEMEDSNLQRMLTAYVRGKVKPIKEQDLAELGASYQIAGWLEAIDSEQIPTQKAIHAQLKKKELTAPFEKLIAFYQGREQKMQILKNYKEWPPLLIHGLGGAGKSTLIAKFIMDNQQGRQEQYIPFIYLDFDKPGISIREPLTLLFEGVRQLALEFPESAGILEGYRSAWIKDLTSTEQSTNQGLERRVSSRSGEREYYFTDFKTLWSDILEQDEFPLLLVLDSFEEVQFRASEDDISQLFEFLGELNEIVPKLRVVISGRSELPKRFNVKELFIGPFDPSAAIGFLAQKGVKDVDLARRIFTNIGGNPLSLTLAASIVLKEIEAGNTSHDWLFHKVAENNVQELLFRRNLQQIHDHSVRQLAFPGLLVRQISPEVIQHILAQPCNLGKVTKAEAEELFIKLKKETFLVNIDEHGRFRFRPDLRKLLIDLIQKDDPERTHQIHDLAVEYYRQIEGPAAKAEQIYHSLRRGDNPKKIESLVTPDTQAFLESNLSEFSPNNYHFLAGIYGLEVPEEVQLRADYLVWEEKMVKSMKDFLVTGHETSFPSMIERLEKKTERTNNSPLRPLEAQLYELAGQFKPSKDKVQIILKQAKEYKDIDKQLDMRELLARIANYEGNFQEAEKQIQIALDIATEQRKPIRTVSLGLYYFQCLHRLEKSIASPLEKWLTSIENMLPEWKTIFQEYYRDQIFIPSLNNPKATMSFLQDKLDSQIPSDIWASPDFQNTIPQWLRKVVSDFLIKRWRSGRSFNDHKKKVDELTGDINKLENFSKARLNIFLREIIPPSTYEIALYNLLVYAESEGKMEELIAKPKNVQKQPGMLRIFISYSTEDENYKVELEKHLVLLRRNKKVELRSIKDIPYGGNIQLEIQNELAAADIILVLISPNYLWNEKLALERNIAIQQSKDEESITIPILLKPIDLQGSGFEEIRGLPDQPISTFQDQNDAFYQISIELRRLVDRLLKKD